MAPGPLKLKKLVVRGESVDMVLGEYDELGITIFKDGGILVEWCSKLMLDEILQAVEQAKRYIGMLNIW